MSKDPTQPTGSHEHWSELAAGYALHALEPDELQVFSAHLAGCAICQAEVDDLELVAAQLGAIGGTIEEPVEAPAWSAFRAGLTLPEPAAVPSRGELEPGATAPVIDLAARRQRRLKVARPVLAAAAAAVVLSAGGVTAWRVSSTGPATSLAAQSIAACAHSLGCHTISLAAQNGAGRATVIVDNGLATVAPDPALKPASAGQMYVLWQMPRSGNPQPIGSFQVTGSAITAAVPLATSYGDTLAFAISREPAGALPTVPTTVIATGPTA